jgi:outer membrane protein OmpA-like peptidoglycan-associated protein
MRCRMLAVLGMFPCALYAQQSVELNAEFFRPTPGYGVFGVNEAGLIPHLKLAFEALFNFAQNPVVAEDQTSGEITTELVSAQTVVDFMAAVGIKNVVEFGVAIPMALAQSGEAQDFINGGATIAGSSLGDVRFSAKLRLMGDSTKKEGFKLAFAPEVSLPTGNGEQLFGAAGPSALLPLVATMGFSKLSVSANAGPRLQESVEVLNLNVGRFIEAGVGAVYRASDKVALLGEVNGAVSLDDLGVGQSPSELRAGARFRLSENIWLPLGAGVGLTNGFGSPDFRVILGVSILPENGEPPTDPDEDGLFGSNDKCPNDPEDKDNFEDKDGCPEDNDKDGIADVDDECVNTPGIAEFNGCPDSDGDKIADKNDACVNVPGVPEFDGCPDKDGDKIADSKDQCPEQPGTTEFNGCPDSDGDKIVDSKDQCPEKPGAVEFNGCPDSDGDKIADNKDACPTNAEDFDRFEDTDGCPETDNDQDTFVDNSDKCPNEKEDGKGKLPKDGCPDNTKATIVGDTIFILDKVYFDTGKDTLQKRSYPVLDAVVKVLSENPQITKIEVQGHTDDQGNDASNLDLSERRAKRVKDYMMSKGIEESRLLSKGYGETAPLQSITGLDPQKQKNELKAAREQNRRVEFKIAN